MTHCICCQLATLRYQMITKSDEIHRRFDMLIVSRRFIREYLQFIKKNHPSQYPPLGELQYRGVNLITNGEYRKIPKPDRARMRVLFFRG